MLQQQAQSQNANNRPMPGNFTQQAIHQPMNQFYGTPLSHPSSSSMGYMPQQQQRTGFVNQHQLPGIPTGSTAGQTHQQNSQGMNIDQNDPLFLMKK
jgi:hypothetical protein